MANAGSLSLVLLIFGPFLWRKFVDWRIQRKHAAQQRRLSGSKERMSRLPSPLSLPSNALVVFAFVVLLLYHGSAVLLRSRRALQSDLFLLLGRSVNTPTATLRTLLEQFPRESVGWKATWTEEGLNALLRRLGSFEGRRLHLLIGLDPFISCTFCDSAKEYTYYSLATRIAQYGADMFLLGILTLRFDALNTIDDVFLLCVQLTSGLDLTPKQGTNNGRLRSHRHQWRTTVKYLIAVFVLCEAAVLTGFYEFGLSQGRWSHWYANRNLAWHGGMLLLAIVIFLSPCTPHVPALVQIVQSLHRTEAMNGDLRSDLQSAHLTQQIMWQEDDIRQRVSTFYDRAHEEAEEAQDETDVVVERLARHAQAARVDVSQLRTQSRQAAHAMWLNSERVWEQQEGTKITTANIAPAQENLHTVA